MIAKQLSEGDAAPQFSIKDPGGKLIKLSDYKHKHVLVAFLRYAGCPLCNLTIHRLRLEYPMLKANGCEVLAFVQSNNAHIKKDIHGRHEQPLPFPVVGDSVRKYYDMYGVRSSKKAAVRSIKDIPYWMKSAYGMGFKQTEVDGDLFLVPAMFLVSPDEQTILSADYGSSFYDHRTFTKIYEPLIFR